MNSFRNLLEDAQTKCYTICLPCNKSLPGSHFNLDLVESHILKSSPFFKGEYHTMTLGKTKIVKIEGSTVITGEGFESSVEAKIIGEETGYNKNYEPYKMLILDKPLIPVYVDQTMLELESNVTNYLFKEKISSLECKQFLNHFKECTTLMRELQTNIELFNNTYLVLEGYLIETSTKLCGIYQKYSKNFLQTTESQHNTDSRFIKNVNNCIESFILSETLAKLKPVLCAHCKKEEDLFYTKLGTLFELEGCHLSLNTDFICDMSACVELLKASNALTTPLEVIFNFKLVLDTITTVVNSRVNTLYSNNSKGKPFVTSDEIIPLLVLVITQCRPTLLVTQLYFAEHFHWSTSVLDNLSFSLVSFRAAVQYIQTTNFSTMLKPQAEAGVSTKQVSRPQKTPLQPHTDQKVMEPFSSTARGKQFERQLERATKMVQHSSVIEKQRSVETPSDSSQKRWKTKKEQQLGSFLSSLSDDSSTSYGKLN